MVMHDSSSIVLHEAPAIPGLVFRHFRGEADLSNIAAVVNASFAADKLSERITVEGLANIYAHPVHWDPQQDALLAEVNGTLVGYSNTQWREGHDARPHFSNLHLAPEWRGCGLELAMQGHMERRARAAAAAEPGGAPHCFASNVPETWQAWVEVLRALGYAPARYHLQMQRSLLDDDLSEAALPTGLALRPALPEHYRAIWEADGECFRDLQDYVAPSEEDYRGWVATPDLDASLWLVAWDGDQVAGAAINVIHEGAWGETDDLFVRRPWRKRGLGRALLVGSLRLFKARGLTTAGLGVDTENVTGALRLYESVGYRPYQRWASFRKGM
jgi:GNAT superfamily N-acetyltransferase